MSIITKHNYVPHMQAILAHKTDDRQLSVVDLRKLFSNLMSIVYESDDPEIHNQMAANAAVLLAAECESHRYQVTVDTKPNADADYHVKLKALPDHAAS